MPARSRARRKPSLPPFDLGPETPLQRADTITEAVPEDANGMRRKRRLPMHRLMERRGNLTSAQADAADALLFAYEQTQLSPPAIREIYVDLPVMPDKAAVAQTIAMSRLIWIKRRIPRECRDVVDHVVRCNQPISKYTLSPYHDALHLLRTGLDEVRRALGR